MLSKFYVVFHMLMAQWCSSYLGFNRTTHNKHIIPFPHAHDIECDFAVEFMTYLQFLRLPCNFILYPVKTLIARFMGPTRGPSGGDRTQVGPVLTTYNFFIWELFDIKRHSHVFRLRHPNKITPTGNYWTYDDWKSYISNICIWIRFDCI